jgi:hypothetical protein
MCGGYHETNIHIRGAILPWMGRADRILGNTMKHVIEDVIGALCLFGAGYVIIVIAGVM